MSDVVQLVCTIGEWKRLREACGHGARALRQFVADGHVPRASAMTAAAIASADRLEQLVVTLSDFDGPDDAPYRLALTRDDQGALTDSMMRGSCAINAAYWLFGIPPGPDDTAAAAVLVLTENEIFSPLAATSREAGP